MGGQKSVYFGCTFIIYQFLCHSTSVFANSLKPISDHTQVRAVADGSSEEKIIEYRSILAKKPAVDSMAVGGTSFDPFFDALVYAFNHERMHRNVHDALLRLADPSQDHWLRQIAVAPMEPMESLHQDTQNVLQGEVVFLTADGLSKNSIFLQRLLSGMQVQLDFGEFFMEGEPEKLDPITYGLVVKDISVQNAGQVDFFDKSDADVVRKWQTQASWSIGPLPKKSSIEKAGTADPLSPKKDHFKAPELKFTGSLAPDYQHKLANGLPAAQVRLTQIQRFYEIKVPLRPNLVADSLEQSVMLPLFARTSAVHVVDRNFDPIKSSLTDFVSAWSRVQLNVHYTHASAAYASELVFPGEDFLVKLTSTSPKAWDPLVDSWFGPGSEYNLEYSYHL